MARNRLPRDEAFEYYASLGPGRSHQGVADHFRVSRQAVAKVAQADRWNERIADLDRRAMERAEQKLEDSHAEMIERQLKVIHFLQGHALEALKANPTSRDAFRILAFALREERLLRDCGNRREEERVKVIRIV